MQRRCEKGKKERERKKWIREPEKSKVMETIEVAFSICQWRKYFSLHLFSAHRIQLQAIYVVWPKLGPAERQRRTQFLILLHFIIISFEFAKLITMIFFLLLSLSSPLTVARLYGRNEFVSVGKRKLDMTERKKMTKKRESDRKKWREHTDHIIVRALSHHHCSLYLSLSVCFFPRKYYSYRFERPTCRERKEKNCWFKKQKNIIQTHYAVNILALDGCFFCSSPLGYFFFFISLIVIINNESKKRCLEVWGTTRWQKARRNTTLTWKVITSGATEWAKEACTAIAQAAEEERKKLKQKP